jgi:hypothetical protein
MDRVDSKAHAIKCLQINKTISVDLTSEDLW